MKIPAIHLINNNDREINLWLSCDNLLKGAALNALQILESMIKRDLIKIN